VLGETMAYSCGYWKKAKDLDSAQLAKFDLVCRKLNLKPGQKILDIGSGWGGFMKYAVENYSVSAVGINISKEQNDFAKKMCHGLPIKIISGDYRDMQNIKEKFDHIVCIGVLSHIGPKNYRKLFSLTKNCLKDDGLFLLHTIGRPESRNDGDPWATKYIFPNGTLPSYKQITSASEKLFIIEDVHNFGSYYDTTLMAWQKNFDDNWQRLKKNYDDRFYRMWNYYLFSFAGAFRSRHLQLWQTVFSPNGVSGGYNSTR
jgi:cyclopropane-fatty-acyl-phospholipid synthase